MRRCRNCEIRNQTKRLSLKIPVGKKSFQEDKISAEALNASWLSENNGNKAKRSVSEENGLRVTRCFKTRKLNAQVLTYFGSGPSRWFDFGQFI